MSWEKHILNHSTTIKEALISLDALGQDTMLFVVNEERKLIGALTDGDIRRGLLKGITLNDSVIKACNKTPHFIVHNEQYISKLISYREKNLKLIPVINDTHEVIDIVNFRVSKSKLPVDAVIMAGGKGKRLRPLTNNTPKPLLKVGPKPIIEHLIDQLSYYGMTDVKLSIKYLGEQIEEFAKNKSNEDLNISAFWDNDELGTIGSLKLINELKKDYILVCNADLLSNVDYEKFFFDFIENDADLSVLSIPYSVNIPYAVLNLNDNRVLDLKEKPTYTYYSNGGMYLMKKEVLALIPENTRYSATDLLGKLIELNKKVRSYQHEGYWLDIGRIDDYNKANKDIASGKIKK